MILNDKDLAGFDKSFGNSYAWRVDSVRDAVLGEYCEVDSGCGICDCDEDAVMVFNISRPRYSNSNKGYVMDFRSYAVCGDCEPDMF